MCLIDIIILILILVVDGGGKCEVSMAVAGVFSVHFSNSAVQCSTLNFKIQLSTSVFRFEVNLHLN